MIRLYAVVEGQTEESFLKRVLVGHLAAQDVLLLPRVVTTRRDRRTGRKIGRGGGHWTQWRKDILRNIQEDRTDTARFTTLFDLYGLPVDFPDLERHRHVSDTTRRADLLQESMKEAIGDPRFIPYLQRHEFETLVLAGLDRLDDLLDAADDVEGVRALRASLGAQRPEDVDDGIESAPSRRLANAIRSYRKLLHGPLVAERTSLQALRSACPRFNEWVSTLERLATAGDALVVASSG